MFRNYKNMINRFKYEPSSYTRLLLRQNQTKYAFQISLVFGKANSYLPIPPFTCKLWVVLLANLPFLPPSYKAFRQKCDRSFIILSKYYLFTLLNIMIILNWKLFISEKFPIFCWIIYILYSQVLYWLNVQIDIA